MNRPLKLAATAALAAAIVTGCASPGPGPATVTNCARFAIRSVERHVTVRELPGVCRGLNSAELRRAVSITVRRFSLHGYKSIRRHEAAQVRAHLSYLVGAASREAAAEAAARRHHPAATGLSSSIKVPIGLAALLSWLVTAAAGGYLLAGWLHRAPHRRPGRPGAPPAVAFVHLGFALSGLAVWAAYLLSNITALAWVALGLLLPVVGLGMATLLWNAEDPGDVQAPGGSRPARAAAAAGTAPETQRAPRSGPSGRTSVVLIATHGALATLTVLLALLGAIAAVTAH